MSDFEDRKLYEFVLTACVKLEAKCTTAASAVLLLYKFKRIVASTFEYCPHTVATACIYLAGKGEEDLLKIRDIINVYHRLLHPEEPTLDVDDQYWDLRDGVGKMEMLVLRTLQFKLMHVHPHKYVLHYLKTLENWMPRERCNNVPVVRTAWTLLRDCYTRPSLILNNDPRELAITVIYCSLRIYGEEIPFAEWSDKTPWWKILYKEIKHEKIVQLSHQIMDLYENE